MNQKNKEQLIDFIKSECKKHKVKFDLRKGRYVQYDEGIKTSGYFDFENRILACAIKNPNFLNVTAHEYCHLTQWIDNCKVWSDYDKFGYIIDDWMTGKKNYSKSKITKAVKTALNLELDNEKRTVKLLRKFGMPQKKTELYIQQSNAYILFYLYMLETKKWYKSSNVPYENKNIVSKMSKKFNMNYDTLSEKIRKIFIAENI